MDLWPVAANRASFTGILFRRIGCGVSPDRRGDISSVSRTFASGHVSLPRGLAGYRLLRRIYRATAQAKKLRLERSQLRRLDLQAPLRWHGIRHDEPVLLCVIAASRDYVTNMFTSIARNKALQLLLAAAVTMTTFPFAPRW